MSADFGVNLRNIAEVLASCEQVTRLDTADEKEAWTLAHDFLDLEGSFRIFLQEQLPRLKSGNLGLDEISDLLLDIGEEFRHIVYHIRNSRYYHYLRETSG